MPDYPPIPARPGVIATTRTLGEVTVYYIEVRSQGKVRIQADVVQGTKPLQLQLHQLTYPATPYTAKATYIEATLPVGTHYIAVWSEPPGTVKYALWRQRLTDCPAGCVKATTAAQQARAAVEKAHEQAGLPAPTEEQLRSLVSGPGPGGR